VESARDPDEHEQRIDRPHRRRAVARLDPEQQRARDLRQLADAHDASPIEAIGGLARDEAEHDGGKELSESDESEVEWSVREVVDLPPDGNSLHLHRDDGGHAPRERESKIAMSKCCAGVSGLTRARHEQARWSG